MSLPVRSRVYVGFDNVLVDLSCFSAPPRQIEDTAKLFFHEGRWFVCSARPSARQFLTELNRDFDVWVISTLPGDLVSQGLIHCALSEFVSCISTFSIDFTKPPCAVARVPFVFVDMLSANCADVVVAVAQLTGVNPVHDIESQIARHYVRCAPYFRNEHEVAPLAQCVGSIQESLKRQS